MLAIGLSMHAREALVEGGRSSNRLSHVSLLSFRARMTWFRSRAGFDILGAANLLAESHVRQSLRRLPPGSINFADPDFFATPVHDDYEEMSVINYEAGWKAAFHEQQLRTQFNIYYQVFKDYQADFALTGPDALPGSTLFQLQNALTDSTI